MPYRALLLSAALILASGPYSPPPQIPEAALKAALEVLPWANDPTGWGPLCGTSLTCDTIVVNPSLSALQRADSAPYHFVPDRLPAMQDLAPSVPALQASVRRPMRLAAWADCSIVREAPNWQSRGVVCLAAALWVPRSRPPDTLYFAFDVLSPAQGLSWATVRATRYHRTWQAVLTGHFGE
jgi:hypothetical protein